MITFHIDGKEVSGKKGWTVLEVAKSHGIEIPTLCFHEAVESTGACRLCVVEVDDGRRTRVVISCMYPIREGIKVLTATDRVMNVRRWILEMLLAECPASERVKEIAEAHGVTSTRFKVDRPEETCILCGLCIRSCNEVVGTQAIGFGNRGFRKEVVTPYLTPTADCVGCGTCVTVCPTETMGKLFDRVRIIG